LAMEMQVPVVVVSSVNRNRRIGTSPRDTPPTLDDLRGSGTIGHDADLVIFCEIDPEDPGTALLYVAKNRNGERNLWIALVFSDDTGHAISSGNSFGGTRSISVHPTRIRRVSRRL